MFGLEPVPVFYHAVGQVFLGEEPRMGKWGQVFTWVNSYYLFFRLCKSHCSSFCVLETVTMSQAEPERAYS